MVFSRTAPMMERCVPRSVEAVERAMGILKRALEGSPAYSSSASVGCAVEPGAAFLATQYATWDAGRVFAPLPVASPAREWAHVVSDARCGIVVVDSDASAQKAVEAGAAHVLHWQSLSPSAPLAAGRGGEADAGADTGADRGVDLPRRGFADLCRLSSRRGEDGAMLIYTSGTTGKPKGCLYTFSTLKAQAHTLAEAWQYRGWGHHHHNGARDRSVLVLPLHHVHGLVNVVQVAVETGAALEIPCAGLGRGVFDAAEVWDRLLLRGAFCGHEPVTVFQAVPTVYAALLEHHARACATDDDAGVSRRREAREALSEVRLMVSGSASLPGPILEAWRDVSTHTLLERYGMSEIGMALSQPIAPDARVPGTVGAPLPGVEARIDASSAEDRVGADAAAGMEGVQPREDAAAVEGPLEVRGPGVITRYWEREAETRSAFTEDGWFRTGDVARFDPGTGQWSILGRKSTDIIKTGGYKVSALEIERVMLEHAGIAEVAVVGLPDPHWGERVAAVVVPRASAPAESVEPHAIRLWCKERLAKYKTPSDVFVRDVIDRNAMGKVNKKILAKALLQDAKRSAE